MPHLRFLPFIASATLLLSACSVKEDRSAVPGEVILDMTAFSGLGDGFVFVMRHDGTDEHVLSVSGDDITVPFHVEEVYKRSYRWYVYPEAEGVGRTDTVLHYDDAHDPGHVYIATGYADATGERTVITAVPTSQSATVTVRVSDPSRMPSGSEIVIRTHADGLDMDTLTASGDSFTYHARAVEDGVFRFDMHRQSGYYAFLEVRSGDSLFAVLDLGLAMRETGYDWTVSSLGDVLVVMDLSDLTLTAYPCDWEEGYTGEIEYR